MQVLELLTYRLTPGTTPEAYLTQVAKTDQVFATLPGLLSRSLAAQGEVLHEVVFWASQADADAAGATVMANPTLAPLFAMIDPASLNMQFAPLLWHKPG